MSQKLSSGDCEERKRGCEFVWLNTFKALAVIRTFREIDALETVFYGHLLAY